MLSADAEGAAGDGVVVGLLQAVMAQIMLGRAGLVRLPVIPSPSCCGHGVVRWQHAGSIKRATTPMVGGSDKTAAARGCVRRAHAALARSSARMWPSRSP